MQIEVTFRRKGLDKYGLFLRIEIFLDESTRCGLVVAAEWGDCSVYVGDDETRSYCTLGPHSARKMGREFSSAGSHLEVLPSNARHFNLDGS